MALHSQALFANPNANLKADTLALTLQAINHLGYVQIDTLSVVQRAHLHTLWARNVHFKPELLDQLQASGEVYEHWSHALAYLPISDFRFSLPLMHRLASGERHWYKRDLKLMQYVLDRIREEGPLSAKDFDDKPSSDAMWVRSPSKNALEQLFMEGKLMIPRRINFHKVYNLTERVLPNPIDTSVPSKDEQLQHLVLSFLRAHGIAKAEEIAYLRKGVSKDLKVRIKQLEEDGILTQVDVAGERYVCTPDVTRFIDKPIPRRVKILSPFDNALIQRKRLKALFNFDYQIECYVSQAKRQYGYFSLPVLWGSQFVARMDCKAERKSAVFNINHLHLEASLQLTDSFVCALLIELRRFVKFNNCIELAVHQISGDSVKTSQAKHLAAKLIKQF